MDKNTMSVTLKYEVSNHKIQGLPHRLLRAF
jgi:hypothetical protein